MVPLAVGAIAVLIFILAFFQPQKAFIDDKVSETVPAGAVALTPATPTTVVAAATVPPAPPATEPVVKITDPAVSATEAPIPTAAPVPETTAPAPVAVEPPAPAVFVSGAHETTGTVELLQTADGARILRLVDLATSNGPDVKVYLSAAEPGSADGAVEDEYVSLGALKGNVGSQNYEIPADVDLARYRSVVLWCDRFSVGFGSAPLPI